MGTPNGVAMFGLLPSFTNTLTLPSINSQPLSQIVNVGQSATFMVSATGTGPFTYRWVLNGALVSGANSSTLTTPPTTVASDGSLYTAVVGNAAGLVLSNPAVLNVNTPPTIQTGPVSQTVVTGETATFGVTVTVTGTAPLSYQWSRGGVIIPGATSASYTTGTTSLTDTGAQFSVAVSNALGTASSAPATLTVAPAASPATYYVDFDSGADTSSGVSKTTPWQHAPGMNNCLFNCSLIALQPGDKVIFKGGVTWDASAFPMLISVNGSAGKAIYYGVDQSWFAGASWRRPLFDLDNSTWSTAPIFASAANYVTLDNLEIANEAVSNVTYVSPLSAITVNGGSNVTIQNCYIHGWSIQNPIFGSDSLPSGGIAFYNGSIQSTVKNCVLDGSPESDSGVGIYGGTLIQGNIIENVPNGILLGDPGAMVSGNQVFNVTYSVDPATSSTAILAKLSATIYNNIVHDLAPGASALLLEAASNGAGNTQSIYNNLVWNVGDDSPVIIASDGMGPNSLSNQTLYNNTFVGGANSGCVSVNPNVYSPTNLSIENNHCISDLPPAQAWCWNNAGGNIDCGLVGGLAFTNNVLMTSATAAVQGYTLNSSFQAGAQTASTVGTGLNLASNCGTLGSPLCSDRLGVLRPSGSTAWNVGAYQFQTTVGNIPPAITMQPVFHAVTAGLPATFSVIATGSAPLSYQWQKDGNAIAGANASVYTEPGATVADDGHVFTVVVTNAAGSVTSSPATLAVNAVPGQLTLSSTNVSFGSVLVGTASTADVTLTNSSNAYITISSVSIAGAGFTGSGVPPGLILAPGETATLSLAFAPTVAGNLAGSVNISSDAVGSPISLPLAGTALVPPHEVTIGWDASVSPVFGYFVYRATNLYGPYLKLNSTPVTAEQYTDTLVTSGQGYIYWVTSVAPDTIESVFSIPITITVP